MRRSLIIASLAGAALVSLACGSTAAFAKQNQSQAPTISIRPGVIHVAGHFAQPPTSEQCEAAYGIACYSPNQVEQAYGLPTLFSRGITGAGATIVIVDSYGSPTLQADLNTFDAAYGLPAPPSFKIYQPAGAVPPWDPGNSDMTGWGGEATLDVEYAHAMAPGANIVVLETPVSETEGQTGFPQIVTAEEWAINHNIGDVISQSFSATEQTFPSLGSVQEVRGAYVDAFTHHVTVLAAAGDSGAAESLDNGIGYYRYPTTTWPPSDPLVTGIGGTELNLDSAGNRLSPDVVWNDTYNPVVQEAIYGDAGPNPLAGSGGLSVLFGRPSYQNSVSGVVGNARGVPDISMSGSCSGAVDMYQSFPGQPAGWYPTCGTSEATPEFAGIVALADQVAGHPLGLINPALYALSAQHAPGIVDVTSGNTTVSFFADGQEFTVPGATAQPGYDLASGVGTVYAPEFVYELARYPVDSSNP